MSVRDEVMKILESKTNVNFVLISRGAHKSHNIVDINSKVSS